jgi:hypothetical protein
MSLYGKDPRYSWGVIRNAQLLPIVFPDWTIRIYVPKTDAQGSSSLAVPPRIISCLKRLGVQIVFVDPSKTGAIPPRWWRYLAADDLSVNFFIVRDADSRLSERDAIAVNDWIKTTSPVHCIRDQPSHATQAVVDGLWGGKPKEMHKILNCSVHSMLLKYFGHGTTSSPVESNGQANVSSVNNNANAENRLAFLADALWPRLVSASLCHDSVSCRNWTRTLSFPVEPPASSKEYLGQSFNEHQTVVTETDARAVDECSGRGKVSFAEENTGRQSNDVVSDQADSAGTSSAVKLFDDVSESTNVSAFARLESRWHEVPS